MGYRDAQLASSAPQGAYDTAATLDRLHGYVGDPGLVFTPDDGVSEVLNPGSIQLDTDSYRASETGGGPIEHEVKAKGFGRIYKSAWGAGASTLVSAGLYQQVFTPSLSQFFDAPTLQLAKPQWDGATYDVETYIGCIVKSIEFKMENKGVLMMTIEWDFRTMSTVIAKASLSQVVSNRFMFAGFTASTGTVTEPTTVALGYSVTPLDGIKSWSMKIENVIDAEDFRANNSGRKNQPPVMKQLITGTIDADYVAAIAALKATYLANGSFPLVVGFTTGTDVHQFVTPALQITDPVKSNADGQKPATSISYRAVKTAASTQAAWQVNRTGDAAL